MGVWYATREDVKSALDTKSTARTNAQIDRAIEASSRTVEGFLHRIFYPLTATKYFPWPNYPQRSEGWVLWLDASELYSVTALVADGTTIVSADYFLEPQQYGPPYNRIELDKSSTSSFTVGETNQRNVGITGVFCGCTIAELVGPTTSEALDLTETGVDVSESASVGVGSILRIDSERMIVTGKQSITTGQTITGNLTVQKNDETVGVQTGTSFTVGEQILVDAEYMQIVDIAGNNLIVKRAVDGSTLATHTLGATVYAPRTLVVTRGALGTTAATHLTSAPTYVYEVPGSVRELCVAETLLELGLRPVGYAMTTGSQTASATVKLDPIKDLRDSVYASYGRKARIRSV
jgi:hypothetical protein